MDVKIAVDREESHPVPMDALLYEVLDEGDRMAKELGHGIAAEHSPLLKKKAGGSPMSPSSEDDGQILRHESKRLWKLFLPIMLSYAAESFASSSLMMIIGHTAIGADTRILAALTISGMYPTMLVVGIIAGVASAVGTLCAQAFGGKRISELWLFFQAGLLVIAAFMPLMVLITLTSAPVLVAMGQNAEIVEIAKPTFIVSASALPLTALSLLLQCVLCAQGIAFPAMLASGAAWAVSTPLVLWLAFHTPLGYVGLAAGTVISSFVKCAVLGTAMARSEAFLSEWPGWQPRAALALAKKMLPLVGSGFLLIICTNASIAIFSMITGMLPEAATAVSASGIYLSSLMFALIPQNGMSDAASVRIGNALGSGDGHHAWVTMKLVMGVCLGIGIAGAILISAIATPFASIFTSDAAAAQLAATMIRQLSPLLIVSSLVGGGQAALVAMGKQFVSAVTSFVCVVVFGVPFGLWFAISFDGGIVGLWYGNIVGFLLCGVVQLVWLCRLDWHSVALTAKHKTDVSRGTNEVGGAGAAEAA